MAQQQMTRLRDFMIDGLLLVVPLIAVVYILAVVVRLLARILAPLAESLAPQASSVGATAVACILAFAIMALAVLALGAFAHTAMGHSLSQLLERTILRRVPGFMLLRSIAADFSGHGKETPRAPALAAFDDYSALGFVVERGATDDTLVTVFLPSAPTPAAGPTLILNREFPCQQRGMRRLFNMQRLLGIG